MEAAADNSASPKLGDWLEASRPWFVPPLFSASALERLQAVAALVPGVCQVILEARLGGEADQVDLSIQLTHPSLALQLEERLLPPSARSFVEQWAEPEGQLSAVERLWLEYDLDADARFPRTPLLCARLGPGVSPSWVLGTLLPTLAGRSLSSAEQRVLDKCLRQLPPSARLLDVFSLRGRAGEPLRLGLAGLHPSGPLLDFWRHFSPPHLESLTSLAMLLEEAEQPYCSFDVAEGIQPRLGLEGSFARQPEREPRWQRLLELLVARGLCRPELCQAVLGWPGVSSFWNSEQWPAGHVHLGARLIRGLSHVKLIGGPGLEPQAKIYLSLIPRGVRSDPGEASSANKASTRSR